METATDRVLQVRSRSGRCVAPETIAAADAGGHDSRHHLTGAASYSLLMSERVKLNRRRGFTRLSGKRQVTIPLQALERTGLRPGDELKVEVDAAGRITLTPASRVA